MIYLEENSIINKNNKCVKLKDIDSIKLSQLFKYVPNIVSKKYFLEKFNRPIIDCSNGYYNFNGDNYSKLDINLSKSTNIFAEINPRHIGNIIGITNIFECYIPG